MFDKLIVSEPEGADIKNRSSYFIVTSLVVGVLFVTGVVISIFASDYRLGTENFELVEMIAPVETAAVEPKLPQPRPRTTTSAAPAQAAVVPTRKENIVNINESPIVPRGVATAPNTSASRPLGTYQIGDRDSEPMGGSGRSEVGTGDQPTGLTASVPVAETPAPIPVPPPVKEPPVVKPPVTKSLGVINGLATNLPKPNYPAAAIAVNIQGKVDVQVLIDESGRVVSAKAVSGNALLRSAAVAAARNARFTPTTLSNVPVKVTGVIVYNFSRS
jgi:protein TonB